MWSKTKKALMNRLADSLHGRVDFYMAGYEPYRRYESVFYISVDKKIWFASNAMAVAEVSVRRNQLECEMWDDIDCWEEFHRISDKAEQQAIKETGDLDINQIMERVHLYLNCASIEQCLNGDDYFLYLLAILDRRLGKRRLKKIYENIENEPEWIQRFVRLRAMVEGIGGRVHV